ncbi:hypothetical protein ACPUEK_05965 [Marinomonas gallaica]|uniref:hypothetical protein n=1 Tax=Marinomonas gallaica TaxID=1806667 RepID=UPI003CE5A173
MLEKRGRVSASLLCYGTIITLYVVYLSQYPFYNWDIIPYVGSVLSIDINDKNTLQTTTYQILSNNIPASFFDQLVTGSYHEAVYQSSDVFIEQLNFYLIKPFYIGLIYLISFLGLPITGAIAWISLIATLFSGCLVLYWLTRHTNSHLSFILTFLIGFQSRLFDLGRIATPDALSVSVMLLALFLLFERKKLKTACSLITFAVLIRSNNVIFATLFLSYITVFSFKMGRFSDTKFSVGLLILTVLLYFTTTYLQHGYSWWTLFYHSFVSKLNYPSQFDTPFSLDIYISVIQKQLRALLMPGISSPSTILIFIALLGLSGIITLKKGCNSLAMTPCLAVSAMIIINYGAHFVLFPGIIQWDRFFTSFYVFSTIMLVAKINAPSSFNIYERDAIQ